MSIPDRRFLSKNDLRPVVKAASALQDRAPLEPDEWSTVKNKKQVKAGQL